MSIVSYLLLTLITLARLTTLVMKFIDLSQLLLSSEFLAACYSWRETEMNVVWSAFSKIDTDGDGKITCDEFIDVLLGGANNLVHKSELEQ